MPTATPVPESCSNRGAVPNPQANPGLVADCDVLLAARDILAGSGKLNWSVNLDVRDWDGITIGESRNRVRGLDLSDKQLTGTIPAELSHLVYLTELRLGSNQLTGRIPVELGSLPYLTKLWLNVNQLTGEIPAGLGGLARLEVLSLAGNQLSGEIPAGLGDLARLEVLWLAGNQLTGRIPGELGNLTNLQQLLLSDNQLAGGIPAELGNLANLKVLSLEGNKLTDGIPAELGGLANLVALSLEGNTFTGCIPGNLRHVVLNDLHELGTEFCHATMVFRIGVMESLTGPGRTYGTVASQAKQMAVDEINAAGGIDGRMIELVVEDSKCNGQDAINAYRKLTDVEGVKIILGTSCSGAMLGAAPLAEEEGVVLFSGLATDPDIAEAGDYIFRTAMSDAQPGIDTGNLLWADGMRKLATINESTDYAEGVRRESGAQFEKRGGEMVAEESYSSDTTDFRSQLTKLINARPDALLIAANSQWGGGTIVKQARELGYDGPIYSDVVAVGATALEIAGDAATGLKGVTTKLDPANKKAQEVLKNFRAKYDYVTLPWYLGSAYDDVYITAECLKETGDDQDADGFRDCLYGITWSGTIGDSYGFDDKGEVVGVTNLVVEVLPLVERTEENQGIKSMGPAPTSQPSAKDN